MSTEPTPFEGRYRVRFQDVDHAGIIFFAAIQEYCHEAMEDMQRAAGIPLETFFDERNLGAPLVDVHASYRRPYRHGDLIHIQALVEKLGRTSMTTLYTCLDDSGRTCAEVRIVQVFINATTFEPVPIPDDVRVALSQFAVKSRGQEGTA